MATKPIPEDPVVYTLQLEDLVAEAEELYDTGQFTPLRQGEFFAEVAKLGETQ